MHSSVALFVRLRRLKAYGAASLNCVVVADGAFAVDPQNRVLGELNRLSAVKTLELTVVFDPVGYAQYDQGALLQEHPEAIKEKEFSVFEYNLNPVVGDDHTDHAVFDARANFEQGLSRTAVTNNATGMNVKVLDEELAMIQQAAEEKRVAAWKDSGENFVTAFNNAEGR